MSLETKEINLEPDDEVMARGIEEALRWLRANPGRDALDAATVAVMNDSMPGVPLVKDYSKLGTRLWPQFLEAVRAAVAQKNRVRVV